MTSSNRSRRLTIALMALVALAAGMSLLRLLIDRDPGGQVSLAWPLPSYATFRWTALAGGVIVGASLAVAGVLLQALLRNPLAEPFILGMSSGAGLGVMAAMYAAHVARGGQIGEIGQTWPAIAGALGALAIVYGLGQRRGWLDPVSLVLVGVVVSTICGAGIMFLQHLVPTGLRGEFTTWLMGHISEATSGRMLALTAALAGGGVVLASRMGRAMDAGTLGDDEARSVGLAMGPLRVGMFVLAGVLAAISVALAGPIGFVGLIAPHGARLLLGPRHGPLVLGAALVGIVVVVGADVARQGLDIGAGRMPIGIFTALLGGPAFLWLLRTGRGQS